jgi:hypothetical protein
MSVKKKKIQFVIIFHCYLCKRKKGRAFKGGGGTSFALYFEKFLCCLIERVVIQTCCTSWKQNSIYCCKFLHIAPAASVLLQAGKFFYRSKQTQPNIETQFNAISFQFVLPKPNGILSVLFTSIGYMSKDT